MMGPTTRPADTTITIMGIIIGTCLLTCIHCRNEFFFCFGITYFNGTLCVFLGVAHYEKRYHRQAGEDRRCKTEYADQC